MSVRAAAPYQVLIAGGGPAAIEAGLRLQRLAGDRVAITLVAPDDWFVYRPLAVAEPFGFGETARYSLRALAVERGFGLVAAGLASVDVVAHRTTTTDGGSLRYDALLLATGARGEPSVPGALTFGGPADAPRLRAALEALPRGPARAAFVATPTAPWTLPVYELAIMAARWARDERREAEIWLVTYEGQALGVFGEDVAGRVAERLSAAGVRLWTGGFADCVEDGRLWLDMEGGLPVDLVVALPRPVGAPIPGLPSDADGFVPVDGFGAVPGAADVYAAGDVTTRPLRQGGLATQQADAAASAIAARAGAPVNPEPYRPALRGLLLTGRRPEFLSRTPGQPGEATPDAPWWPPHKIAGRELGPYLAAHPELRDGELRSDSTERPGWHAAAPGRG